MREGSGPLPRGPPRLQPAFLQDPSVEVQRYCWEGNLRVGAKVSPACRSLASEYELMDTVLGTGMSGTVLLGRPRCCSGSFSASLEATSTQTGSSSTSTAAPPSPVSEGLVAVKTLEKKGLTDTQVGRLLLEVDIYLRMDHVNIAKLLRVFNEAEKVYLVMEYCSGGSLCDRLLQSGPFSDQAAAAAVRQVLSAVNYCHCHPEGKVCHRDLKHSNFIYSSDREGAPLKLVDFGLSRVLQKHRQISSYAGTLYYMAPEVVLRQKYDESCDLWSVGVIAYSLLCGEPPFGGTTEQGVVEAIARAHFSMDGEVWKGVSENAKDLIRRLLQVDPSKRPTAEQALQHPWLVAAAASKCWGPQVPVRLSKTVLERVRRFAHESAVRRAAAALVVYSRGIPGFDESARLLEAQFRALDADGNGTISAGELVQALQETLGVPPKEAAWIFSQLDVDGDTELHHSEFLAAAMGAHLLRCTDTVREAFSRFDLDRDGKIDLGELLAVLGPRFCGTPTQDIFNQLDKNGDSAVDLDEFSSCIASPSSLERGSSAFDQPELEPPPEAGRVLRDEQRWLQSLTPSPTSAPSPPSYSPGVPPPAGREWASAVYMDALCLATALTMASSTQQHLPRRWCLCGLSEASRCHGGSAGAAPGLKARSWAAGECPGECLASRRVPRRWAPSPVTGGTAPPAAAPRLPPAFGRRVSPPRRAPHGPLPGRGSAPGAIPPRSAGPTACAV